MTTTILEKPLTDTDLEFLQQALTDHGICCEFEQLKPPHGPCSNKAEWILFRSPCVGCGRAGEGFACTPCKDARMTAEEGVWCQDCGELYSPARHRYCRIEAL